MDILIARENINDKPEKINLTKIKEQIKDKEQTIIYFDRDNSHKNMMNLVDSIEGDGYSVYFKEIKYGMADDEYMYGLHII